MLATTAGRHTGRPEKNMQRGNLLATRNGRFLTFGLLYISEGIPYGFTSVAMVAFMRQQGVSLELIGSFVAALFLPWAFKWAWAPVIDLVKLHRLGGRRAWIIGCTVMMILTLLVTALVDFRAHFHLLLAMIVRFQMGQDRHVPMKKYKLFLINTKLHCTGFITVNSVKIQRCREKWFYA